MQIVGAPSFFPTVWGWIKRWFDPITVSKIFILSDAQAFPVLSQFIATENIPKQYGGTLDFKYGDVATIDPDYADRITWRNDGSSGTKDAKGELRRWPKGPTQWIERDDGNWDLLAVGSLGGKQRREVVATMKFDGELGGGADHSIHRPQGLSQGPGSNGAANENVLVSATSNGSLVSPQATTNASLPIRTTTTENNTIKSTLLPIAVPGAAPTATDGHIPPGTDARTTNDLSTKLPPEPATNSAQPVPLAAIAQPLPGNDEMLKG